jgi:hypothetical protein
MQHQDKRKAAQHEDSGGSALAELGFDLVGDFVPDSLLGFIVLILVAALMAIISSAMHD